MSAFNLKASLHEMIEHEVDENILGQIKEILTQNRDLPIDELGGQTALEFNKEMEEAEAEINRGEFSSQEEVVSKFEKMFHK